jgi:hypothetical protein
MHLQPAEMKSGGSGVTARLADHHLLWRSWSVSIRDVSDFSLAIAAVHAGVTGEPDAVLRKRGRSPVSGRNCRARRGLRIDYCESCEGYRKCEDCASVRWESIRIARRLSPIRDTNSRVFFTAHLLSRSCSQDRSSRQQFEIVRLTK